MTSGGEDGTPADFAKVQIELANTAGGPAMVSKVAAASSKSKASLVMVTVGPMAPEGGAASRPEVPEGGDLRVRQDSARDAIKALKMAWKVPPHTP